MGIGEHDGASGTIRRLRTVGDGGSPVNRVPATIANAGRSRAGLTALALAATLAAPAVTAQGASDEAVRIMTIPRAAIVDMTRAQARVICTSEPFLGCMGFDSEECLTLSESAIERCLMPLPPEIDPTGLDNATLEACPREVYEEAGYTEEAARPCFDEAVEAAEVAAGVRPSDRSSTDEGADGDEGSDEDEGTEDEAAPEGG